MTDPEPRNSNALKKECVTRWNIPETYAPTPTPMNMYPSCEIVEYASTFLMSHCLSPIVAAKIAVSAPTTATVSDATGDRENNAALRAIRYTPAVTIVAAWIKAETGVGPAIASGSQVYRGSCADLPTQPQSSNSVIMVIAAPPAGRAPGAAANTGPKSSEPVAWKIRNIATRNPTSPMRLTMNAFFPASALTFSLNQKPINRYEQSPTPSQPTNASGKLAPSTRISMKQTNRFRYAK